MLQFGYSNFICSHCWNTEDELFMAPFVWSGAQDEGNTRAVIFYATGGLGALQPQGHLCDQH